MAGLKDPDAHAVMPAVLATVSVVTLLRLNGMVGTPKLLSPFAMKYPCPPVRPSTSDGMVSSFVAYC